MRAFQTAVFESADCLGRGWNARLDGLVGTHTAYSVADVPLVLQHAELASQAGYWVALAITYEAAPAFEPAAVTRPRAPDGVPLAWAGIYEHGEPIEARTSMRAPLGRRGGLTRDVGATFHAALSVDRFVAGVTQAQQLIRDGDTYQVNLTFPLKASGLPDPQAWYAQLFESQQAGYCAWLDLGRYLVLSFSPELFFERRGPVVTTRPMKGTIRRGRWLDEDDALARELVASDKARAENVMIVDLLRNDIGRIAETGTVRVPHLYTIERYPTLWQMTSTIEGRIPPSTTTADVFRALFPCGSVTGAPKIRTMEIIRALEPDPRGLYCGALGFMRPGGDSVFSVAIRTIVVDRETETATMGVGAGITVDSVPEAEYEECLLKAAFAMPSSALSTSALELIETMRLEDGAIPRLERHVRRVSDSARYFGFRRDESAVRTALSDACTAHPGGLWRLRLIVDREGRPATTCAEYREAKAQPWRVAYSDVPIDVRDVFLFNKTTNRCVHEAARRRRPDVDDVLLWNGRGEVTESTIANLVAEIGGERWTPPVASGLLPGTMRAQLLDAGTIRERTLTRADVAGASRLWLINSLRGWVAATLVP